jgi:hypothetical protein
MGRWPDLPRERRQGLFDAALLAVAGGRWQGLPQRLAAALS